MDVNIMFAHFIIRHAPRLPLSLLQDHPALFPHPTPSGSWGEGPPQGTEKEKDIAQNSLLGAKLHQTKHPSLVCSISPFTAPVVAAAPSLWLHR